MPAEYLEMLRHLLLALLAGGLVGLERSYHGRPAGFRTHALVCMSSSLLMLVTLYQSRWFMPSWVIPMRRRMRASSAYPISGSAPDAVAARMAVPAEML